MDDTSQTIPIGDRLALSVDEAVRRSGIGRSTLYELMQTGQLAYAKIGARRLILVADLHALLAAHRCTDTQPAPSPTLDAA